MMLKNIHLNPKYADITGLYSRSIQIQTVERETHIILLKDNLASIRNHSVKWFFSDIYAALRPSCILHQANTQWTWSQIRKKSLATCKKSDKRTKYLSNKLCFWHDTEDIAGTKISDLVRDESNPNTTPQTKLDPDPFFKLPILDPSKIPEPLELKL